MSSTRSLAGARRTQRRGAKLKAGRMRWRLACVLLVALLTGCTRLARPPRLIIDESVDSDFAALAQETWHQFLTVFQARAGCFGDVRLRATRTLGSRAVYDPDTATVTVRVPGTAALLQGALVHEWAHHIEFQCDEQRALRPAFLAAVGAAPDTPWRPDDALGAIPASMWAGIPSEQYAETAVVLVLGGRPITTGVRVTEEAVRVVGEWAAGD